MTTVSEAIRASAGAAAPNKAAAQPAYVPTGAQAHAREATKRNTRPVVRASRSTVLDPDGVVRRTARVVTSDVAGAWVWRGSPPTLRDLWAERIPDIDRVPAANVALWAGWVVFNHLALLWTAALSIPLWVLQHPMRTALAALLAAPLVLLWIFG